MANEKAEPVTEEFEVVVKVLVTGLPGTDFNIAAQNAATDIDSVLMNRTIHSAGCNIAYKVV